MNKTIVSVLIGGIISVLGFLSADSAQFGAYGPAVGAIAALLIKELSAFAPAAVNFVKSKLPGQ